MMTPWRVNGPHLPSGALVVRVGDASAARQTSRCLMRDEKDIELHGADGIAYACRLLDLFELRGKRYALLSREGPSGEANTVILGYREEDGRAAFRTIEDDEEF